MDVFACWAALFEWYVCLIAEVETQADLSAMNEKFVWAKELPSRRMPAQYAVGPCPGGAGKGERVCGWELVGGRIL